MNSKWIAVTSIVIAFFVLCSLPQVTAAQSDRDALAATYRSSATVSTGIAGIKTFPAPPEGFDPLAAADSDLARYGYPPHPDPQTQPDGYALWAKDVKAFNHRPQSLSKDMGAYSMPMQPAKGPAGTQAASVTGTGGPSTDDSSNWSGVVNTNKLTKWNDNTSFDIVTSEFTVPAVTQPIGSCDGGYDWTVTWNGVDGYGTGDVVQGGGSSQAYCSGSTVAEYYCGWVEWYPSYPIICEFTVKPGDVMSAVTFASAGTVDQLVCIADLTQDFGDCYTLSYISGPGVTGKTAEAIVERPCCRGSNGYPLANYTASYWYPSEAYDGHGTVFVPSNQSTSTVIVSMYDDLFDQVISYPVPGTGGLGDGKYGIAFFNENCARSGGCTP
ncbi:MAG TPA: G1 family glutamic endopeptidase [Candidatus Binatus sp.]|jgi:hypothetical protein|nr:G1 family glutamic endopeptidase [Candidatus Binatus sp.]